MHLLAAFLLLGFAQTGGPHPPGVALPGWKGEDLAHVSSARYQREMVVPQGWSGRRIVLAAEAVNSLAVVFLDEKKSGEIRFPAGEVDLTSECKPGEKQLLCLLVVAMPLKAIMLSYGDMNAVLQIKGTVARRGLCGEGYLVATPPGARWAGRALPGRSRGVGRSRSLLPVVK